MIPSCVTFGKLRTSPFDCAQYNAGHRPSTSLRTAAWLCPRFHNFGCSRHSSSNPSTALRTSAWLCPRLHKICICTKFAV